MKKHLGTFVFGLSALALLIGLILAISGKGGSIWFLIASVICSAYWMWLGRSAKFVVEYNTPIGHLDSGNVVYRRKNGHTYIKLNEKYHVRAELNDLGTIWQGAGAVEELDPQELVSPLR